MGDGAGRSVPSGCKIHTCTASLSYVSQGVFSFLIGFAEARSLALTLKQPLRIGRRPTTPCQTYLQRLFYHGQGYAQRCGNRSVLDFYSTTYVVHHPNQQPAAPARWWHAAHGSK